ncbi:MAG: hypothetical protein EA409_01560 [Saprospirales bacterium]|nr:MAG: hypothetical protein EA409_01560 [Saprospirales bacterium]
MKKRLVLWGEGPEKERVLVAIGYESAESTVKTHIFPEDAATEEFVNQMMNLWREGNEVPLPDRIKDMEQKITEADKLIPDGFSTERDDLIDKAKAEWVYLYMSDKLASVYRAELEDISEKVENARRYEQSHWDELKVYWDKVQKQIKEKNLLRSHYLDMRKEVDGVFNRLKDLRKEMDELLRKDSDIRKDEFFKKLEEVEEKIKSGMGLKPLFDDLKSIQRDFHKAKLVRDHKNKVWKKMDALFKEVKEKRFGEKASKSSVSRTQRRYDGLVNAIKKMEKSIDRDKKELDFQDHRIGSTAGQLEAQIRKAKIKMIEERMKSKQLKLDEMLGIKTQLESRLELEKEKEEKKKQQEEIERKKQEAKKKIEEEMKAAEEQRKGDEEKIIKAAASIGSDDRKRDKQETPAENSTVEESAANKKKVEEEKGGATEAAQTGESEKEKTPADETSGESSAPNDDPGDKVVKTAVAVTEVLKDSSEEEE